MGHQLRYVLKCTHSFLRYTVDNTDIKLESVLLIIILNIGTKLMHLLLLPVAGSFKLYCDIQPQIETLPNVFI